MLCRTDSAELSLRGSRHPACAVLAYLARSRTVATNAELAPILWALLAESVPNLTWRFCAVAGTDPRVRKQLRHLEERLDELGAFKVT